MIDDKLSCKFLCSRYRSANNYHLKTWRYLQVRHERTFNIYFKGVRNCARDEGRPLGAGLQAQASNHLKLLWSKALVMSVDEKAWQRKGD
jgi:hypothetical protein